MVVEVGELGGKFEEMMGGGVEGMGGIEGGIESVCDYVVVKRGMRMMRGVVGWGMVGGVDVGLGFVWGLVGFGVN